MMAEMLRMTTSTWLGSSSHIYIRTPLMWTRRARRSLNDRIASRFKSNELSTDLGLNGQSILKYG